ncbi:MAG: NAD(P)(+) transhydrogenase (Re/Si-specific) subunit alpha, partial [Gammaproteobacteria bacterium]|nr:NAD(P)(+) transhydrogenase (Re/Si-specific) subunit alpha [Gammaproteobacteria bacterium]NIW37058.1 NAD(P)(+) transhydrogenase (Re/Si-specific) subunit alpha [Gemmatimonadota bacterium]
QVPGKKAPVLITEEMVKEMRPGSVIVDLAAETGGNCELTEPDKTVVKHGVTIIGPANLPAMMPDHASQMYSKNIGNLVLHLAG